MTMFEHMIEQCCGNDGKPDVERLRAFKRKYDRTHNLDRVGWGLFFIWAGVALMAGLSAGAGLLGVAVIILGLQAFHWVLKLEVDRFWMLVGSAFAILGVWELLEIEMPLVPVLLIVLGVMILGSMLTTSES